LVTSVLKNAHRREYAEIRRGNGCIFYGATDEISFLEISNGKEGFFDLRATTTQCLRMFEIAPLLAVELRDLTLSTVQSEVLASRPHPTRLKLLYCLLEDEGSAFVDALQKRNSTPWSFWDQWNTSSSDDNLKRLLKSK
jgi:hypothetical protein